MHHNHGHHSVHVGGFPSLAFDVEGNDNFGNTMHLPSRTQYSGGGNGFGKLLLSNVFFLFNFMFLLLDY